MDFDPADCGRQPVGFLARRTYRCKPWCGGLMRVFRRPARSGVLVIVVVSGMGLLAGMKAAAPAAARVDGGAVPAGSGGAQQWVSFYSGPGAQEDDAAAIAVARNGSAVFVTGSSTSADGIDRDYATVAYKASSGAKLWAQRYTGVGGMGGTATAVAVDRAGERVFVTGYSLGAGTATDYVTIAYNAVTGARLCDRVQPAGFQR